MSNWVLNPYLHIKPHGVENPITNKTLTMSNKNYRVLRKIIKSPHILASLRPETVRQLVRDQWLVADEDSGLAKQFFLKYVTLEANTHCNQACYFCPVSVAPRESNTMPLDVYESILRQLVSHQDTIQGIFMSYYNEPTVDRFFIDRVRLIKSYGFKPAVLSNGTGLTPKIVDQLIALGGVSYLSINLSTLDPIKYQETRGYNHLKRVLQNLEYAGQFQLADTMKIIVLGEQDDAHCSEFDAIHAHFADSMFNVEQATIMDRAGYLVVGLSRETPLKNLCGCEQTGSRPFQHLHITAQGKVLLCCQDYSETYVVGNIHNQSVDDILSSQAFADLRRKVYGLDNAPANFICRRCIYAQTS